MIRLFAPTDLQACVRLLDILHRNTPYAGVEPHWQRVVKLLESASTKPDGVVLVADHGGKVTGLLVGVAQSIWWRPDAFVASDLLFYSQHPGDGLKMLMRFKEWARQHPRVVRIECGVSSGKNLDDVAEVYIQAGFTREGSVFALTHSHAMAALRSTRVAA